MKPDQKHLEDLADAVLCGVAAYGCVEDVIDIADHGWPEDFPLRNDSPELRKIIQERADALADELCESEENDEDEEEEET